MQGTAIVVLLVVAVACIYGQEGEHHHPQEYIDYEAPPYYHYEYAVHDSKTHDFKSQQEAREGDHTKGQYTLLQPDGYKRIVDYEADKHGIRYNVKYESHHDEGDDISKTN